MSARATEVCHAFESRHSAEATGLSGLRSRLQVRLLIAAADDGRDLALQPRHVVGALAETPGRESRRGESRLGVGHGDSGRARMIVFPLIRLVGLKAATASSRVETLPMFVRSRPSRTRWTISLSWARSDSTTKSIARPSA